MTTNLIVYGSLLNKDELKMEGIHLEDVELVRVQGFKRVFNQEAKRRFVDGIRRAVLNIQKEEGAFFNALLIKNLPKSYFETLDIRELGYDRITFKEGVVKSYFGEVFEDCVAYVGKKGYQDKTILPNEHYFEICLEGAKSYSTEFYKDYLNTTFENSDDGEISLKDKYKEL